jgi:hypothetical protein
MLCRFFSRFFDGLFAGYFNHRLRGRGVGR